MGSRAGGRRSGLFTIGGVGRVVSRLAVQGRGMGELRDVRSRMTVFGFCGADHDRRVAPDAPVRSFVVVCEECQEQAVRIRIGCEEGEVRVVFVCSKCKATERYPARLVDFLEG